MSILLLGGGGQIGRELLRLASNHSYDVVAPPHSQLDIGSRQHVSRVLESRDWKVVINSAAYTNVDGAEANEKQAFLVNAEGATCLAEITGEMRIPIIHISTDYIFGGSSEGPFHEGSPPSPVNTYGKSKLAGEVGVRANNPQHIILRTAWVHSPYGNNFVKTISRIARERDEISVVSDQKGNPTSAAEIAEACLEIVSRITVTPDNDIYGTYHFCGSGDTTWFDFAKEIIRLAGIERVSVKPITTAQYPTAAIRAGDTRLDCSKIKKVLNIAPRPWLVGLQDTLGRLKQ